MDAARHCVDAVPYRMVVYLRNNKETPLYCVAGAAGGPWSAKNALKKAFSIHGGDCFYCGSAVGPDQLSIDHAEPVGAGGKSELQNLLIAHKGCNATKGNQPIECYHPEAGREWLSALLAQVQDRLRRL